MAQLKPDYKYVKCFLEYSSNFEEATKEDNDSFKGHCRIQITNDLTRFTHNSDNLIEPCVKFVQFLTRLSEKPSKDKVHGCIYLYYWLYHAVMSKDKSTYNTFTLFETFSKAYKQHKKDAQIYLDYVKNITKDAFLNIQTLAVLYENLENFKKHKSCGNNKCNCAHNIVELYMKYIDDCRRGVNTEFCNELDNFRNIYNEHMEKPNECDKVQKILPSARITDNTLIIITPFVIAFVLSFILFILYKFTRFGLLFSSKRRNKKHIRKHLDKEEHEHFERRTKNDNISNNNRAYHIQYRASANN
ncbi:variable surface protein Vir2/15-like [Plasmodium vivax]|uniref:Variable surface protein Vir2/15-like n=1 Tax=Plasmodium vivax (strain Salvador I) TaxID=126793 RepID=A5KCT2_PLAVS|nr:variable surface protein Vir2/15-like [Plasmodium vivax]EDL42839.1 variable surface protein Vir2/15-like [Plasmodium vivax]|eukprot:XP_001608567.1 variable surface protein Vir2/15-like [Plasmodium vivax Sal-1]